LYAGTLVNKGGAIVGDVSKVSSNLIILAIRCLMCDVIG